MYEYDSANDAHSYEVSKVIGKRVMETTEAMSADDLDRYFGWDTSAVREDVKWCGRHVHESVPAVRSGNLVLRYVICLTGSTSLALGLQLNRYEVNTYIDGERAITRRRRSAKEVAQVFMHDVDEILEDVRESGKHTYNERAFGRLFSHVITISE